MKECQLDAVGLVLEIEAVDEDGTAIDFSDATTLTIRLRDPAGTVAAKTAGFTVAGADGKIRYTTVASDLSVSGQWSIQGRFQKTGMDIYTKPSTFFVNRNV